KRLDLGHLSAVWRGEAQDRYGELAVTGTLALVIRSLGPGYRTLDAHRLAREWWCRRHDHYPLREAV
ncbi:MAG TPA: hypothetical protein VET88_02005, partial [Gammaproteobacteria bacterium]|nr:hypothetical protein [Gammaproteobacteria bacterium]